MPSCSIIFWWSCAAVQFFAADSSLGLAGRDVGAEGSADTIEKNATTTPKQTPHIRRAAFIATPSLDSLMVSTTPPHAFASRHHVNESSPGSLKACELNALELAGRRAPQNDRCSGAGEAGIMQPRWGDDSFMFGRSAPRFSAHHWRSQRFRAHPAKTSPRRPFFRTLRTLIARSRG